MAQTSRSLIQSCPLDLIKHGSYQRDDGGRGIFLMGPTREMMGEASDLCSESTDKLDLPCDRCLPDMLCVYVYRLNEGTK